MNCKCKYFLRNKAGQLVCSVCGKPANGEPLIEDKQEDAHEDKIETKEEKRELYVSDKDRAAAEAEAKAKAEAEASAGPTRIVPKGTTKI